MNILIADVPNVYFSTKKKYNAKLDYFKVISFIEQTIPAIQSRQAFIPIKDNMVHEQGFMSALNTLGFSINLFEKNPNVSIALKVMELVTPRSNDNVIFMSNNYELIPLYKELRNQHVNVYIVTAMPSPVLCNFGTCIQIPEEAMGTKFE